MMDPRIIVHNLPKSANAEAYRTIRSNIRFSSTDREIKSLLITSSGPEEGKSLTCANLAVAFAASETKVLLIDADLRKPNLHRIMNINKKDGLTNILSEHKDYKAFISRTEVSNLDVLSSGPVPPNPSEMLSSKAMKSLMEQLKSNYDIVIVDTPPVGLVTDAQILSTLVDGAILVVASEKAKVDSTRNARDLLKNVNSNILGVILNRVKKKEKVYYYEYSEKPEKKQKVKKENRNGVSVYT
jgi:capsular exopolysaccharide synthesis family protein